MLIGIIRKLDSWINAENRKADHEGFQPMKECEIRVIGQFALLEASLSIELAATADVDVLADYEHSIKQRFEQLLQAEGLLLDPVAHEAWMPKETQYNTIFSGRFVTLKIAGPDFVIISKAKKAPQKNRDLIVQYLAQAPSERFFELAEKYEISLEKFLS